MLLLHDKDCAKTPHAWQDFNTNQSLAIASTLHVEEIISRANDSNTAEGGRLGAWETTKLGNQHPSTPSILFLVVPARSLRSLLPPSLASVALHSIVDQAEQRPTAPPDLPNTFSFFDVAAVQCLSVW